MTGVLGSLSGGAALDLLKSFQQGVEVELFRQYFAFLTAFFLFILYLIYRLENLGAYSIQDALSIIFSPRDLTAVGLLNKLAKSKTLSDEKEVIQALGVSRSQVSADNLLKKLDRFCFLVAGALEKRIGFFVILLKGDES